MKVRNFSFKYQCLFHFSNVPDILTAFAPPIPSVTLGTKVD